jgi:DNA-binding transcriptional ArsR family regulator
MRAREIISLLLYWELANCLYGEMISEELEVALRALANDRRLQIMEWLKDPRAHFRPQVDGDLVEDGVCTLLIAEKLEVSQPTVSEHLKLLSQAGLIRGKRIRQWVFYKRDEARIRAVKKAIQTTL